VLDPAYYGCGVMQKEKQPFWDGKSLNLPPIFGWGSGIGAAPPNQQYPGYLNIKPDAGPGRQPDEGRGAAHAQGRGLPQPQLQGAELGAGGIVNLSFQGHVDFGNNTTNALDSGFGYANAALGVFTQYLQASKIIEGNWGPPWNAWKPRAE
jgi:hypothetical protein